MYTKSRKLGPAWRGSLPGTPQITSFCLGECFGRDLFGHERFNHVALLDVTVPGDTDTTLHAVTNFAGIVFETPQRSDFTLEDDHVVTQQPHFGVALDNAVDDLAARDRSDLGNAEGLPDLGTTLVRL